MKVTQNLNCLRVLLLWLQYQLLWLLVSLFVFYLRTLPVAHSGRAITLYSDGKVWKEAAVA
jgi:hypothetical protein